ncbi:Intimal thickness related receptor IRP [Trinorchestia longiramus]|nr:Intimal thickness related receptor IRP [Trinorchestia longiramus]
MAGFEPAVFLHEAETRYRTRAADHSTTAAHTYNSMAAQSLFACVPESFKIILQDSPSNIACKRTSQDNSNNPQQSGTGKPKFNATLVLLPRQFFFNFYGNSSTAALNSPNNYDKICQAMFKDVLREAYDAHCHDDGDEDFLRHVPCPVGQLCVDEDNPKNVIPNSQLTYAIKDVNNPRFWYLSLVACGLNESCGWQYSGPVSVSYHLTLVNGKPPAKDHDFFAYHFSCEQQRLRVLEVFLCALCLQTLGLVFATTAQLIMGASGRWVEGLVVSGQVCTLLCEAVFLLLLVLLARGWAVTATTGHHTLGLYSIWGSYAAVTLMLYAWNLVMVPPMSDSYQYGAWLGIFALVLRGALTGWYLWELRSTMLTQQQPHTLHFLLQLGAASLVWLVYLPVVALVALQVSPLWRPKLLQGFRYTADLLAHLFMAYTLYPRRSHPYVTLATSEDHCDELDLLDQAPQVLHRRRRRGDSRSSLSVTFDGEDSVLNGDVRLEYTNLLDADETVQFDRLNGQMNQGATQPIENNYGSSDHFVAGSSEELSGTLNQTDVSQFRNNSRPLNQRNDGIEKVFPLLAPGQFHGTHSGSVDEPLTGQLIKYSDAPSKFLGRSGSPASFEFQVNRNDGLPLTKDEQHFGSYRNSGSAKVHTSNILAELDDASGWSPELGSHVNSASNDQKFTPGSYSNEIYAHGDETGHKVAFRNKDGGDELLCSDNEYQMYTSGDDSRKFAHELNTRLKFISSTVPDRQETSHFAPVGEFSPQLLSDESDSELLVVVQDKKKSRPPYKH